jgi:hypothetical protein
MVWNAIISISFNYISIIMLTSIPWLLFLIKLFLSKLTQVFFFLSEGAIIPYKPIYKHRGWQRWILFLVLFEGATTFIKSN